MVESYFLKETALTLVCVESIFQVIKEVPADRLLVWQVKQGWEPLCQVELSSSIFWEGGRWKPTIQKFEILPKTCF